MCWQGARAVTASSPYLCAADALKCSVFGLGKPTHVAGEVVYEVLQPHWAPFLAPRLRMGSWGVAGVKAAICLTGETGEHQCCLRMPGQGHGCGCLSLPQQHLNLPGGVVRHRVRQRVRPRAPPSPLHTFPNLVLAQLGLCPVS